MFLNCPNCNCKVVVKLEVARLLSNNVPRPEPLGYESDESGVLSSDEQLVMPYNRLNIISYYYDE